MYQELAGSLVHAADGVTDCSLQRVGRLLDELEAGNRTAFDELFPLLYEELRELARRQRQHWQGDYTLNTTALVHEAYLKLVDQKQAAWETRAHFLAAAAKAMRHILMNYARRRRTQKRGGDRKKLSLEALSLEALKAAPSEKVSLTQERAEALAVLDGALKQLKRVSARQCQVVECRFFGAMTIEETAAALGISTATVSRCWAMAQAWLYRRMKQQLEL